MRKQTMTLITLVLSAFLLAGVFSSCGKPSGETTQGSSQTTAATTVAKSDSRIDSLLAAWAGLDAKLKETLSSSVLNAKYGCESQHVIILDDQQFMVMEFDLGDMNSTARNFLDFADKNGYVSQTSDPVWHNGEFVLHNTYSVLESGEVKAKFEVESHPKSDLIISTFQAFK